MITFDKIQGDHPPSTHQYTQIIIPFVNVVLFYIHQERTVHCFLFDSELTNGMETEEKGLTVRLEVEWKWNETTNSNENVLFIVSNSTFWLVTVH